MILYNDNDGIVFKTVSLQTVANHPEMKFEDTVAPGKFAIQCFINPRKFHGSIHGIVGAVDLEGQAIDKYSMQVENGFQKGRWTVHDRWWTEMNRELNHGYSGACFIMGVSDLSMLANILYKHDIHRKFIIPCLLVEVN